MKSIIVVALAAVLGFGGCAACGSRLGDGAAAGPGKTRPSPIGDGSGPKANRSLDEEIHRVLRRAMVDSQIRARGIHDEGLLDVMRRVPRHRFVPEGSRDFAYQDGPLPIGEGQTISQPYIVGLMTDLARPRRGERVLEIGTGSGYQAAVLAELGADVYTIEIIEPLAVRAAALLSELGYSRVHTRVGDGYRGWPEAAPFDAIIVTAAPGKIPQPLKDQLRVGGRLVIPVGSSDQELLLVVRTESGYQEKRVIPVRFVPMTGEAEGAR